MNMKNIKTKIILSAIFLSIFSFSGAVNAASASLYVSPASITKTIGNIFNASVGVNASGNKVCAVEGALVFDNLTCQSITIASDVMVQSTPTCSNPHYLIGIPNCTTSDKTLLTVSVKAGDKGTASLGNSDIDIIGEGISLGSVSVGGSYIINSVAVSTPEITTTESTQIEEPEEEIIESTVETAEPEVASEVIPNENNTQQASLIDISSNLIDYVWLGLVLLVILCGIYYFIKRKKK